MCLATVRAKADLGVIFDTDVDRGGAVDERGEELNRNRLVAVASAIALEGNPGGTIVTDSITSSGLKEYIEQTLGGHHHRFKRGYRNVINEALRLNREGVNCPLAIETSGHAALRENYFLDDGAYLVTKIIIKLAVLTPRGQEAGGPAGRAARAGREPRSCAWRSPSADFRACGNRVIDGLEQWAKVTRLADCAGQLRGHPRFVRQGRGRGLVPAAPERARSHSAAERGERCGRRRARHPGKARGISAHVRGHRYLARGIVPRQVTLCRKAQKHFILPFRRRGLPGPRRFFAPFPAAPTQAAPGGPRRGCSPPAGLWWWT